MIKRLEKHDSIFKWENQIFTKIGSIFKRSKVNPQQAFEHFDDNKDGVMDKDEFERCLYSLKIDDLNN